jgi:hypothetical protein
LRDQGKPFSEWSKARLSYVQETRWFQKYCDNVRAAVLAAAGRSDIDAVVLLAIEGGPVSILERITLPELVDELEAELCSQGQKMLALEITPYAEFEANVKTGEYTAINAAEAEAAEAAEVAWDQAAKAKYNINAIGEGMVKNGHLHKSKEGRFKSSNRRYVMLIGEGSNAGSGYTYEGPVTRLLVYFESGGNKFKGELPTPGASVTQDGNDFLFTVGQAGHKNCGKPIKFVCDSESIAEEWVMAIQGEVDAAADEAKAAADEAEELDAEAEADYN